MTMEFLENAKDLKMDDIVVVDDPNGAGLKASFPGIEVQPNSSLNESFEIAGYGVDGVAAVTDLNEKIQTAVQRGQLVDVKPALKPPMN
ncbi:MAG: hypothetical protein JKY11_07245 [Alphaproteobacteria bacterium]|nr:hypothetical protein [Alphaproteobacteria bacterium]